MPSAPDNTAAEAESSGKVVSVNIPYRISEGAEFVVQRFQSIHFLGRPGYL
jgi:hypothetical protein